MFGEGNDLGYSVVTNTEDKLIQLHRAALELSKLEKDKTPDSKRINIDSLFSEGQKQIIQREAIEAVFDKQVTR